MDKVKIYLAVLKKHHFWVLCGVLTIAGFATWSKASSTMATKFDTDKKVIEAADSAIKQVAGGPEGPPPNATFKQGVEELTKKLEQGVFSGWKQLYDSQVDLFVWPKAVEDISKLKPDEEIPSRHREFYNDNVVQPEWERVLLGADYRRPRAGQEGEFDGLVQWPAARRNEITSRYFSATKAPSSIKVRLTQEDMWIFESLVRVVNDVNKDARDLRDVTIKRIDFLDLAQWAIAAAQADAGKLSSTTKDTSSDTASPGATPMTGGPGAAGAAAPGGESSKEVSEDTLLLDGRYLDDQGQPLAAGAQHPFAEFKQVFVRMKFIMDQRKVPELLAACANAPLPIETRQLRVRMPKSGGGGSSGGAGGVMGGGAMGGGAMGGGAMGGVPGGGAMGDIDGDSGSSSPYGGRGGGSAADAGGIEEGPYDAEVTLCGVIYIYNPPEEGKVGAGTAADPGKRTLGVPTKPVKVPSGGKGSKMGGGMNMTMPTN